MLVCNLCRLHKLAVQRKREKWLGKITQELLDDGSNSVNAKFIELYRSRIYSRSTVEPPILDCVFLCVSVVFASLFVLLVCLCVHLFVFMFVCLFVSVCL